MATEQQHPLRVLPTSDLVAFARALCEDDVRGTQFIKALESYVDTRRGGLRVFDRFGQNLRRIGGNQRFHAKELKAWGIQLKDIMEELLHGETAQALVTSQVAMSVEDWMDLGVVDFEDLILRVGKPHTLKRWYGPKQWESFVDGIHKNECMEWHGAIWLHCVNYLEVQDYPCMGIVLSAWFDEDSLLFAEAITTAKDWIGRMTAEEWKEHAHLEHRHYAQLAGVARSSVSQVTAATPGTKKRTDALSSWL